MALIFLCLISYLGLTITTLHLEIPLLTTLHIEFFISLGVLAGTLFYSLRVEKEKVGLAHPLLVPLMLVSGVAFAPILTSLATQDYLAILQDGEFKSLLKALFIGPCIFYFLRTKRYQDALLKWIILFYSVLGVYFLYRFLVLNEVREFDLRPTLRIRHGDPNFLCAFFAMIVPLALLQGLRLIQKEKKGTAAVYIIFAVFLTVCALATESRMGILALLLGLLFVVIPKYSGFPYARQIRAAAFGFILLMGFIVSNRESVASRFIAMDDKSSKDRLLTFENGIKVFLDQPLFGAGMHKAAGSFFANSAYPAFQSESKRLEVHNSYLNILAELGGFGFAAFAALLVWAGRETRNAPRPERYFLTASFLILLLSGLTVGLFYKDLVILQIFILAGVARIHEQEYS